MMEESMEHKRAWLYCRIANETPESDWCIKAQLSSLKRFTTDYGYKIAGVTCEYGTGTTLNRPGLQRVIQAVHARKMDVLIIKSLSRLARGYQETAQYIDFLNQQGISLISFSDGLELSQQDIKQIERCAWF